MSQRMKSMARFSCAIWTALCWARLLGGAAALLGEREQARAYYEQAIEQCTQIRNRPELALSHLQLAELLLDGVGAMNRAPTQAEGDRQGDGEGRTGLKPAPTDGPGGHPEAGLASSPLPEGDGRSGLQHHPDGPLAGAGGSPALPGEQASAAGAQTSQDDRAEAMRHLDIAIAELRDMKMQPALERALRHKEFLGA